MGLVPLIFFSLEFRMELLQNRGSFWSEKIYFIFIFNYKNITLFSLCFLFSEICMGNSDKNNKKVVFIVSYSNFLNRKQNKNQVTFLKLKVKIENIFLNQMHSDILLQSYNIAFYNYFANMFIFHLLPLMLLRLLCPLQ